MGMLQRVLPLHLLLTIGSQNGKPFPIRYLELATDFTKMRLLGQRGNTMNSAMLNYDDFDLDTATAERYSLRDAIQKASEARDANPDAFVRIKSAEAGSFIVVKVPANEVYDEWMNRIQRRFSRMWRKRASR